MCKPNFCNVVCKHNKLYFFSDNKNVLFKKIKIEVFNCGQLQARIEKMNMEVR